MAPLKTKSTGGGGGGEDFVYEGEGMLHVVGGGQSGCGQGQGFC